MTGAGFGGCTVNLVETRCVESFRDVIARSYRDAIGLTPQIFLLRSGGWRRRNGVLTAARGHASKRKEA